MHRTTRSVNVVRCDNCTIEYLLGQKFNGQACCLKPKPRIIGKRMIVEYTPTHEEEKADLIARYNAPVPPAPASSQSANNQSLDTKDYVFAILVICLVTGYFI